MQCLLVLQSSERKYYAVDYRRLDVSAIDQTIVQLERRISERFPESHLRDVARELIEISQESAARVDKIKEPILWVRLLVWLLLVIVVCVLLILPFFFHDWGHVDSLLDLIQVIDPSLSAAFFIAAFVIYLLSLERSVKRGRALQAIHELRSMAHVIDMHQLTKDPVMLLPNSSKTASSPERVMTNFELSRYFDYCSEMLSLISKVAALYIQEFDDAVAISAVDEVESLTAGLNSKIYQKMAMLDKHSQTEGV